MTQPGQLSPVEAAARLLADRRRILVFTGAGISTESGIPDFRGPEGVWAKVDPSEFTFDRYLSDPGHRRRAWETRFTSPHLAAEPNPAHHAVVELWETGRMIGCVTQNVDRLHTKAGLPREAVVEVHGNAHEVHCLGCGDDLDPATVEQRWREGDPDPHCTSCGGLLKTKTISFGEPMPADEMGKAMAWADEADAVIVIGSTISVYPAAYVPLRVAGRGEPMVIVNRGETDHDRAATAKIDAAAGTALPELVALLSGLSPLP